VKPKKKIQNKAEDREQQHQKNIGKGLFWGNLVGIGIALLQLKTGIISLDPSSYYIKTVPINLELSHILMLNAGTMAAIIIMLLVPSQLISRITPVKAIKYD
jgi:lipoprotein-releasing system permease protein